MESTDYIQGEDIQEFVAERILTEAHTMVPYINSDNTRISVRELAACADQLVVMMRSWFVAGKIPSEPRIETFTWPDGVWQTFKHLHMPNWFISIFPVRFIERRVVSETNHYFVCPHVDVPSGDRMHYHFMMTGNPQFERFRDAHTGRGQNVRRGE